MYSQKLGQKKVRQFISKAECLILYFIDAYLIILEIYCNADKENYQYYNIKSSNSSAMGSKQALPSLSSAPKKSNEAYQKEKYIKYKSLLQKSNIPSERNNRIKENCSNNQSSYSSSQNMSINEMLLDKVYGTIEKDAKNYL